SIPASLFSAGVRLISVYSFLCLFAPFPFFFFFFFFNDTATTEIYTLSLHDALPICAARECSLGGAPASAGASPSFSAWTCGKRRSEEHTSELQSRRDLVCRLLLEKKKKNKKRSRMRSEREEKHIRQSQR